MNVVLVVGRNGIFASLNQRWHVALVNWIYPHWGRS